MDVDMDIRILFVAKLAMACTVILLPCLITLCCMIPLLRRICFDRSNGREPQNEEEVEMGDINREPNWENSSNENELEQLNGEINPTNPNFEG